MLSFKCWVPISRLFYSLYMVNPLIIVYSNGVRAHPYYLSYDAMVGTQIPYFVSYVFTKRYFNPEELKGLHLSRSVG